MAFDPIAYINEPRWQESRLGLDRIRELLDRLGRPQDQLKFVHVAGTNGKGSTCAYLASILQAAGYRTGLFTSPFIETFEERIRVDGKNITSVELGEVTLAVRDKAEAMAAETGDHPTEFELMTAVALVHFVRSGCQIVVLEVGLGGRLDSTNVIEDPEVAVIARIGLDHTKLLGNTLAAIAHEKVGIVKRGAPVVSWPQEPEAMAVVLEAAQRHDVGLAVPDFTQLELGEVSWNDMEPSDGSVDDLSAPLSGKGKLPIDMLELQDVPVRTFSYKHLLHVQTRLLGKYQPQNAALALEAVEALRERGWAIDDDALRRGLERTVWPGRFELVDAGIDSPAVVVDGGHNPQGARALADSLADVFPEKKPVFIIGVLEDKDYPAMLEAILPLGSGFVTITPDSPRALSAEKLARAIRWAGQDLLGCSACTAPYVARGMSDALEHAFRAAGAGGVVCAFGSLYSIGAFKAALSQRQLREGGTNAGRTNEE